jgi:hypothetical protein
MYTFCKIDLFGKTTPWVLKIDSLSIYEEYNKIFHLNYFKKGLNDIKDRVNSWNSDKWKDKKYKISGHWTSEVARLSEIAGSVDDNFYDLAIGFNKVTNDVIEAKLKAILNGDVIYVYETCQWFVKPDSCKIIQTTQNKNLQYPKYSIDDIRIIKWPNGSHYYAKIGNTDVVFKNIQKWNSAEEAMSAAKRYLKNIGELK